MSKMSMLYDELMGQCARLGFQDLGEAEQAGYGVDWQNAKLIKVEDEQDKAHKAWLKEREEVLEELRNLHEYFVEEDDLHYSIVVAKAIKLLEKGEC